ncbi:centromere DNA-binding protein complex CBF3 subunit [Hirsutella rhossiliensis]|uniref:Centromere DNA-binding protein complex CBF3 subunit n=1 Tax=Hirsutella rhossiliensis TaxID=111463 RepID=A0A9P8SDI0_9HYPO|nr:centromere DNA-binding protein complex CBF3 subunit [Hirsutella rhossiliensis]KAH0957036.1 centromere DNA-binding protein complex CBF3 subunit [Hirsutella rhossiliensis]
MNCGKTNQHGRMEYGSALRHRDPRSCLIGALAFWLFWRWQVEKAERFPVFQAKTGMKRRCSADRRRSLKGASTLSLTEYTAPLSGQTAREWTSRFYKKAGIKVSKVSHAPRVAATQNADMAGWMKARHVICPRQAANPLAWADPNYTDPPSRSLE